MNINWFTVIAQIINFLVLVYLLKRFLYGPIVKAMDERQSKIEQRENEAQEKILIAEGRAQDYIEKTARLDQETAEILYHVRQEAEAEKKDYMEKARDDIDAQKKLWQDSMMKEEGQYMAEMRRQIGSQSYRIAKRVLEDLATMKLEKILFEVFLDKLASLDSKEKTLISDRLVRPSRIVVISSAFAISEEDKLRLQMVIKEALEGVEQVEYRVSPEIISGVQLEVNGYHLEWSIGEYLKSFEERFLVAAESENFS